MTPQTGSGSSAGGSGVAAGTFGVGALGAMIAGFGQYESGQEQRTAYDINAANQEEAIIQKTGSRVGKQASAYAASGVDIQSGSPLLIMAATAARGAGEARQTGDALRYEGAMAAWSGTMSGIGTFLGGISKAASQYNQATFQAQPTVPMFNG